MTLSLLLTHLVALLIGCAAAWWSWHGRLDRWPERCAAFARAMAVALLVLLLLDPGIAGRVLPGRALVLLDNSISMHATGGHAAEAHALARSLGDTTTFGELFPGEPGAYPGLADALSGALAGGRPVTVVTDGEIGDTAAIPAEMRAAVTTRIVPRRAGEDIALTEVRAPSRLSAGDTLWVEVDAVRTAGAQDSSMIEVSVPGAVLLRGTLRFGASRRGTLRMTGVLPTAVSGEAWLDIARVGAADAEPDDDLRWWRLIVTPTPGVVVLAAAPDWDARLLYRTLHDVVDAPVRGYVQLEPGAWRRMDDLRRVAPAEVAAAAKGADLLAVHGAPTAWQTTGRARFLWVPAEQSGDWYLGASNASPVAGAFAGASLDSLQPATAITALDAPGATGWIGATARLARRGTEVPVLTGREGPDGRTVTLGAEGLYRWAFAGGVGEQLWRSLIANAASWLLAGPGAGGARATPIVAVTERGQPVRFRWNGTGPATLLPLRLERDTMVRRDTLRFDGNGEARLALPVGRYRYLIDGGGTGSFAVEPFSIELVPATRTLTEHVAAVSLRPLRRSLREGWWLFALAVLGFGVEWSLRRRFGLR